MERKKSNLRKPAEDINSSQTNHSSWFSRIHSKLSNNSNDVVNLKRQDLKRVTFSLDHLTKEHILDEESTASTEIFNPTLDELNHSLPHLYEKACYLREEPEWPFFMELLHTHRTTPLTTMDLANQIIHPQYAGPIADILLIDFGLKSLNLSNCHIDDDSIRIILNSLLRTGQVTDLDLSHNPFKTKGFKYISIFIAESTSIKSLNISKCSPDRRATQYLSRGIRYAPSLKHLSMDQCALKSTHLETLSTGICQSTSLISLSLCYNRFSSSSGHWLATMILNSEPMDMYWENGGGGTESIGLQKLDLSGNNLIDAMGPFCQSLYHNRTLQHLSVSNCQIYPHGCELLADALYTNQRLISLDLSGNPIIHGSDEGIQALKTALLRNDTLQELKLVNTDLDATATITLAEVLPMNTTLNRLDLSENPSISLAGILALSISIKMNSTLTFLDISIPNNDREMADLQNDIAAVCTTNMIQRIETREDNTYSLKGEEEEEEEEVSSRIASSSPSTSSSSTSISSSNTPIESDPSIQTTHRPTPLKIPNGDHNTYDTPLSTTQDGIITTPSEQSFPLDEISLADEM
ncbi:hypothetical protein BJ944DRAFT_273247 [Cunninghamella echinulata]|nr:hypothetical protein BJ944DRAFT_273247 [Cunninghamella echinulata]